ncbi:hypothetical protein PWEIH_00475 [Listeria weihenstephanensis FSL R9-0317]|uniref:Uncharacterized protein n=1 Tax=Listeria weihenstephanensis TaxID=1006155 RepID=A0A1S7FSY3_9LIST|nr:hypothetical protein [Listeria weihenstephanensis]AQY50477.1 hypothetical protein UE46_05170 [Listeria phage LWP01] [Listeria weihenstephanensis]AQY52620.1 hypothetical protein UE46_p05170 [Listeria phage LWP01]EUJ41493.1 hypothetical protein PWEIH_00475 [Listeria weihenstephanensis FSL R9-0317]
MATFEDIKIKDHVVVTHDTVGKRIFGKGRSVEKGTELEVAMVREHTLVVRPLDLFAPGVMTIPTTAVKLLDRGRD